MTQSQLDELAKLMWSAAAGYDRRSRLPYLDRTPAEQAEKLREIYDATDHLLKVMASLKHQAGQSLQEHPYDVQIVFAIQNAHFQLAALGNFAHAGEKDAYPVEIIRSLETFSRSVEKAITDIKPKRGNSTNRGVVNSLKSNVGQALIFRYRLAAGDYPTTGSKGWAASLLNAIFSHYGWIGDGEDSGSVWLRREIKRVKEAA